MMLFIEYLSKLVEKKLYSMEILGESYKFKISLVCKEFKFL